MTIRKAAIEDLNSLSILFDHYRIFYKKTSDLAGAKLFLTERITNGESVIFVAQDVDNVLAGFVQLYPLFSSTRMKRLWLLNDLYVETAFRGLGISVSLINACKELCLNSGSFGMVLETEQNNTIGNNLYHQTGFVKNIDHNYYEWETSVKPAQNISTS